MISETLVKNESPNVNCDWSSKTVSKTQQKQRKEILQRCWIGRTDFTFC